MNSNREGKYLNQLFKKTIMNKNEYLNLTKAFYKKQMLHHNNSTLLTFLYDNQFNKKIKK